MLNAGRGSGEVARHQMRYLANEGHTVSFLVPGEVDPVPGVDHRGVRLHDTTLPVHEYLPSAGEGQEAVSLMSGERAFAYVDDYVTALDEVGAQADILFAHHGNLTAIAAAVVGARYGKPYVLFLHGTGIEPRHHDGYDDDVWTAIAGAIEGAAGILVTTEYVRDELVRPLVDLGSWSCHVPSTSTSSAGVRTVASWPGTEFRNRSCSAPEPSPRSKALRTS
jgi:hypothetical protein